LEYIPRSAHRVAPTTRVKLFDRLWVRIVLGLFLGLPVTFFMGIVSLLGFGTGIAVFLSILFRNPSDIGGFLTALALAVWGLSGAMGLAGAWMRLCIPTAKFQSSSRLRRTTAVMLAAGLAAFLLWVATRLREPGFYRVDQRVTDALIIAFGALLLYLTLRPGKQEPHAGTDAEV
jgi:hypothetical protein